MPATVIAEQPFTLFDPSLIVNYDEANSLPAVQLNCAMSQLRGEFDRTEIAQGTFCSPGKKITRITGRRLIITVRQSFGVAGLWNLLTPMAEEEWSFALLGDHTTVPAPSNVEMSGRLYIPEPEFLSGDQEPTESMTYELSLEIDGIPVYTTTDPGVAVHPDGAP